MRQDISEIIGRLIEYNKHFMVRGDFMLIHSWLEDGCTKKDILTAMDHMMGRNKQITSVAYFTPRVYRERDNRLELEKVKLPSTVNYTDEKRAHDLRLKLKWTGFLTTAQEDWLKAYEMKSPTSTCA